MTALAGRPWAISTRQVGPGQGTDPIPGIGHDVGQDLRHAQQAVRLEALRDGQENGVSVELIADPLRGRTHCLRGHGEDDQLTGALEGCRVGGDLNLYGERDVGQVALVAPLSQEQPRLSLVARQQSYRSAARQVQRERRAP